MKLSLSLIFCAIVLLLYVTTIATATDESSSSESSSSVSAEDFEECATQYLKSKGKLKNDIPVDDKKLSACLAKMQIGLRTIRDKFENRMKMLIPNEANCLVADFDNKEILDYMIQVEYVMMTKSMTASEKSTETKILEDQGTEMVRTMAATCGVSHQKLLSAMTRMESSV